jgi:L-ascorbate metabolism protein UlaG (beta-lactamase superfamily)
MAKVQLEFLGGATFRIVTESGQRLLIDPYLDEEVGCPIRTEEVEGLDLLLLTHGGTTHTRDALAIAKRTECEIMCGMEVQYWLNAEGIAQSKILETTWGVVIEWQGLKIRCVPAWHPSFSRLRVGSLYSGLSHGYIITTENGHRIYHMGDTAIFGDLKLIGELYKPELGLVPVGRGTKSFYAELPAEEAALATQWLGLQAAIPCHFLPDDPDARIYRDMCSVLAPRTKILVLNPGGTLQWPLAS